MMPYSDGNGEKDINKEKKRRKEMIRQETWILKGVDYTSWRRESTREEIVRLYQAFKRTATEVIGVKLTCQKDKGRLFLHLQFPNGIGEHMHIHFKARTAIRILTS